MNQSYSSLQPAVHAADHPLGPALRLAQAVRRSVLGRMRAPRLSFEEAFLAAASDHADLERRERQLDRQRDQVRGMLRGL
jgi:hypothetical protein